MFSNSKISVYNWIVVGVMALTFIVTAKLIFTRWKVAGITDVVGMA